MHRHLSHLGLVAATLLFSFSPSPLTPYPTLREAAIASTLLLAQAPTNQNRKAEADRLLEQGMQQFRQSQFREALQTFEQVLVIYREIGDRKGEGATLNNIGEVYRNLGRYAKALEFYQQALAITQEIGDRSKEGETLDGIGGVYRRLGHYSKALEFFQQALAIRKEVSDKAGEGTTLNNIGEVYHSLGQYSQTLEYYQQALTIRQEVGDKAGEGETISNIGLVYDNLGQYSKALEFFQQASAILKQVGDRATEGITLNNIGAVYRRLGQYSKALEFFQQALAITKEVGDKAGEGSILNNMGSIYDNLGQYPKALEFYQQALGIHQEVGDKAGEGKTLNNIAGVYSNLGQYSKALESFQQALAITKEVGNRAGEGTTLNNMGAVYNYLGQYPKALEYYQQSLSIRKQIGDKTGEGETLNNMGVVYNELGQYPKALEYYQQALAIRKQVGYKAGEGATLNNIGFVYRNLGQYSRALEFFQQALAITKEVGDRAEEGVMLNNIGFIYNNLGQYPKALEFYQQALAITREVGDKAREGTALNNIGLVYNYLGQYLKALEYYQQALAICREVGNRPGEGTTLNNIGGVYLGLGQYPKALEFYQQALAISKEVGNKEMEVTTLSNIGSLLNKQNQPELAIVFLKQSVNVTETIRQDLRVLPQEQQKSYTETVAGNYRALANSLLSEGRILEAQQILELLKIQELRDFTRNTRAGGQTFGIALNPTEEKITRIYGSLIAFGQQVDECKKTQCNQLSQFNEQLQALTQQYNQSVQAMKNVIGNRLSQDRAFLNPETLSGRKAREIVESQPGTVLIYPLVLDDKIWLVWASSGGIIKSLEVPVKRRQIGETALKFRELLQSPSSRLAEVKATGKQLYDWLIKPLEAELKANKIQNLVFSLDRVTRYIPMSALFDGEKYLIENYTVSTVLSADLTDLHDKLPPGNQNTSVLGLGLSDAVAGFNPLPNVPAELDAIVRKNSTDSQGIYPGLAFINKAFNFPSLRDNLIGKKILHIATHGQFVAGRPEDSYLLLGTGEKLTVPEIETLQDLADVHLVVLSACETALGGPDAEGLEISGISFYFLNKGAKAVMASLWQVNDQSTSKLMQAFYRNLANSTSESPITKAAALRQAQLSLMFVNLAATSTNDQRNIGVMQRQNSQPALTSTTKNKYSHPYYWAPFILMGNGL